MVLGSHSPRIQRRGYGEVDLRQVVNASGLFQAGERVGVAVSGGVDSVCLLHALHSLTDLRLELTVCHIDHGLRAESGRDAEFVRRLAADLGLPFVLRSVNAGALARERRLSLEMAARELRYAELRRIADSLGLNKIALGHHCDDQVETILMRILRGTGLEGLSGMGASRENGLFVRPLLAADRAGIAAYAREHGLAWVEDATNQETDFLRNRIRHNLLPLLRADYNPNVDRALLDLASLAGEALAYLQGELDKAWPELAVTSGPHGCGFAAAIADLPPALGRLALRRILAIAGGDPGRLSQKATARIWDFVRGSGGARRSVPGGFQIVRRGGGFLLHRPACAPVMEPVELPVPGRIALPDGRSLIAEWWPGNPPAWEGVSRNEFYLDGEVPVLPLFVRSRRPGDRFVPLGLGKLKKIKEVLIEDGIPREERDAVPVVTDARERIVWLAGVRPDGRFGVTDRTRRILRLRLDGR